MSALSSWNDEMLATNYRHDWSVHDRERRWKIYLGTCTWGYIIAPRYQRGQYAVRKESDEDLDADPILWAAIPTSATCGDSVSWCKPRTPRAARAAMRVLPSE